MTVAVLGPFMLVAIALTLFGPALLEISKARTAHTTYTRGSFERDGRRRLR